MPAGDGAGQGPTGTDGNISIPQSPPARKAAKKDAETDGKPGLWDPLPITVPTYVSKPLAPRTVRTIDLSAPDVTSSGRQSVPVTADAPEVVVEGVETTGLDEQDGGAKAASA